MNPNEASANKTYNVNAIGTVVIPLPANPSGKLILVRVIVNTKGGSSNTATIYDSNETLGANTSYLKGKIDTTANVGSIECGYPMFNGIYIVIATGTAADLTIVYKQTP